MIETKLWLVRHPEPEPRAAGRCYGTLDVKLSEAGVRQAHAIAEALHREPLDSIYTSPSRRCAEAARVLAAGRSLEIQTLDALRELNFGDLEGRTFDEIAELYPDLYRQWMEHPTEIHFPGGESFSQMRARVVAAFHEMRSCHAGQSAAAVTHGGVIRILLAEALEIPAANVFRIAQGYGAINLIRYFDGVPLVELVNNGTAFSSF